MNFVYVTENLINGKKYVGSHCTEDVEDSYLGSGIALGRAFKKYGKANFKRTILEHCDLTLDARKLEEFYIKRLNTLSPRGYNISPTGGTGFGVGRHSDETKLICSLKGKERFKRNPAEKEEIRKRFKDKSLEEMYGSEKANEIKEKRRVFWLLNNPTKGKFGENNPNFGKKRTEETKKKISESNKDKPKSEAHKESLALAWKERKINFPTSQETIEKMRKSMMGKNAKCAYKLTDPDNNVFFTNNLTQFAKEHNLQKTLLHKVASGDRKHHKGWKCEKLK